jgi:predicted RNA-binding protein with TRAM domain
MQVTKSEYMHEGDLREVMVYVIGMGGDGSAHMSERERTERDGLV